MHARYKHKLSFKSGNRYIGDVTSYNDSDNYRISRELLINGEVRIEDYSVMKSGSYEHFLLSGTESEISKYLSFLRSKPYKAALVHFDSAGSCGLFIPMNKEEMASIGGIDGFKCCIVELKKKKAVSADNGNGRTNVASISGTETGEQQRAAAAHYNDLKRERATRHLSHIYHLRNMNNFIKSDIISSTATRAKLTCINSLGYVPKGISVIDFGCGMGGDIFKWFKNKEGTFSCCLFLEPR
jgi:hypothetical protein